MNKKELIVWLKDRIATIQKGSLAVTDDHSLGILNVRYTTYMSVLNKLGVFLEVDHKQTSDK